MLQKGRRVSMLHQFSNISMKQKHCSLNMKKRLSYKQTLFLSKQTYSIQSLYRRYTQKIKTITNQTYTATTFSKEQLVGNHKFVLSMIQIRSIWLRYSKQCQRLFIQLDHFIPVIFFCRKIRKTLFSRLLSENNNINILNFL